MTMTCQQFVGLPSACATELNYLRLNNKLVRQARSSQLLSRIKRTFG